MTKMETIVVKLCAQLSANHMMTKNPLPSNVLAMREAVADLKALEEEAAKEAEEKADEEAEALAEAQQCVC